MLEVTNSGTNLSVNGQIAGDTVTKTGPGTLTLGNAANSFTGGASIQDGTLVISRSTAIPANGNVTVGPLAEFRLAYNSGSNSAGPIGTLTLGANATFSVENPLNSSYYLNRIEQGPGGRFFFSAGGSFDLILTGPGARIDVAGINTWARGSGSRIVNDTGAPIDLSLAPGALLINTIPLANGINGQGFRLTGGGTIKVSASDNTAALTIAGPTTFEFSNVDYLGTGAFTLDGGKLDYTGSSVQFAKAITLAVGRRHDLHHPSRDQRELDRADHRQSHADQDRTGECVAHRRLGRPRGAGHRRRPCGRIERRRARYWLGRREPGRHTAFQGKRHHGADIHPQRRHPRSAGRGDPDPEQGDGQRRIPGQRRYRQVRADPTPGGQRSDAVRRHERSMSTAQPPSPT